MKKAFLFALLIGTAATSTVYARTNKEIKFREIPWGMPCSVVEDKYLTGEHFHFEGEWSTTNSIDGIIYGQFNGKHYEHNDINIVAYMYLDESDNIRVAGYTPTEIGLYYAYTPDDNGKLNKTHQESMLYGAEYIFEPQELYGMRDDIEKKLSILYGEPDNFKEDDDNWIDMYYTYTFWEGNNNTEVVLVTEEDVNPDEEEYHTPNKLRVVYLWTMGDDLLQKASDAISQEMKEFEASNYDSDDTEGL